MKLFSISTQAQINEAVSILTPFFKSSFIQALVNKDPAITEIDVDWQHAQDSEESEVKFGNKEAIALMLLLKNNRYVTTLTLSNNTITSESVAEIVKNRYITSLDLSLGNIDVDGVRLISDSPTIEELSLGDTYIPLEAVKYLAKSPSIKTLRLNGCSLTDQCANILAKNKIIEDLNVCCNQFTAAAGKAFSRNTKLNTLDISGNALGDEGAIAFVNHPTIETLNLEATDITFRSVGRILKENKIIQHLDLSQNPLGDEITESIALNSSLKTLTLVDCIDGAPNGPSESDISDYGFTNLFKNRSITEAYVGTCGCVPDHIKSNFKQWLERNKHRAAVEESIPPAVTTSQAYR